MNRIVFRGQEARTIMSVKAALKAAVIGVMALFLSACSTMNLDVLDNQEYSFEPLGGSRWFVTEIYGRTLGPVAGISFEAKSYKGTGPCNKFSGFWMSDDGKIGISTPTSTKRGCPDLDTERALFSAMVSAVNYDVVDNTLMLMDSHGDILVAMDRAH